MRAILVVLLGFCLAPPVFPAAAEGAAEGRAAEGAAAAGARDLAGAVAAHEAARSEAAHARAAALLAPHAEAGAAEAQYRLGRILTEGRGGRLAIGRGLDWLLTAYRAGDGSIHHKAGLAFATTVIAEDLRGPAATQAQSILEALVACGMPAAMTALGYWSTLYPTIVLSDGHTTKKLFQVAATRGHAAAQNNLAQHFLREGDYVLGFAWAEIAARNGSHSAARMKLEAVSSLRQQGLLERISRAVEKIGESIDRQPSRRCTDR